MVFIPILVWLKLRNGVNDGPFSVDGTVYTSYSDYTLFHDNSDLQVFPSTYPPPTISSHIPSQQSANGTLQNEVPTSKKCRWPFDQIILNWHQYTSTNQIPFDIYVRMIVMIVSSALPTLVISILLCLIIKPYWFVLVWMIVDISVICCYYVVRYIPEIIYSIFKGIELNGCLLTAIEQLKNMAITVCTLIIIRRPSVNLNTETDNQNNDNR
jgi:hypothetical protein